MRSLLRDLQVFKLAAMASRLRLIVIGTLSEYGFRFAFYSLLFYQKRQATADP